MSLKSFMWVCACCIYKLGKCFIIVPHLGWVWGRSTYCRFHGTQTCLAAWNLSKSSPEVGTKLLTYVDNVVFSLVRAATVTTQAWTNVHTQVMTAWLRSTERLHVDFVSLLKVTQMIMVRFKLVPQRMHIGCVIIHWTGLLDWPFFHGLYKSHLPVESQAASH